MINTLVGGQQSVGGQPNSLQDKPQLLCFSAAAHCHLTTFQNAIAVAGAAAKAELNLGGCPKVAAKQQGAGMKGVLKGQLACIDSDTNAGQSDLQWLIAFNVNAL